MRVFKEMMIGRLTSNQKINEPMTESNQALASASFSSAKANICREERKEEEEEEEEKGNHIMS